MRTFLLHGEERVVTGIIYRNVLELHLITQPLEGKRNIGFQHDLPSPRIHRQVSTLPERWFGQGWYIPELRDLQI